MDTGEPVEENKNLEATVSQDEPSNANLVTVNRAALERHGITGRMKVFYRVAHLGKSPIVIVKVFAK